MEIDALRESYETWKQRTDDLTNSRAPWIDATIVFGSKLHLARKEFKGNREFSIWLDHNGFKEIMPNDRAGFIWIGQYPSEARRIMTETNLISIQIIGAAVKRSVTKVSNTDSGKTKKKKVKRIENKAFARRLLWIISRANSERISKSGVPSRNVTRKINFVPERQEHGCVIRKS